MTEWLDVLVYATLTVALWFAFPAWAARSAHWFLVDRNPEWVGSHPDLARKLSSTRGVRVACGVWGVMSLAMLLMFQSGLQPELFARFTENAARWDAVKDLNSMLLVPGGLCLLVVAALGGRHVSRIVPLADRRLAALERRTLDDIVRRPVRAGVYASIVLVLFAWFIAAVLNIHSTPKFWGRLVLLVLMSLAFAFFVRLSVRRPPHVLDRIFGPAFRADEVRFAFALQLLPPVIGSVRLYEEVANTVVVDVNRAMHLGVAMIVTIWVLRLRKYSGGRQRYDGRTTGATLRWRTP